MSGPRAVVVGGSLGGLCAAGALGAIGWDVTVLEQATELEDRGAGIVLQSPIDEFLRTHGLGSEDTVGVPSTARVFLDADGGVTERTGIRQLMTSYDALFRALRPVAGDYRFGAGVESVEGRTVHLVDGSTLDADLVIAADGAGSSVRRALLPDVAPSYAGYVAWRGLVDEASLPVDHPLLGSFTFFTGEGMQILAYLIPGEGGILDEGKRRLNWVWYQPIAADDLAAHLTDAAGHAHEWSLPAGAAPAALIEERRDLARRTLPPVFADLVARTSDPFVQAITDLQAPHMVIDRVALIGDAAAVVRPHTAYGSAKAAADAQALADALDGAADLDAALGTWEVEQRRLADDVVAHGKRLGAQFALS